MPFSDTLSSCEPFFVLMARHSCLFPVFGPSLVAIIHIIFCCCCFFFALHEASKQNSDSITMFCERCIAYKLKNIDAESQLKKICTSKPNRLFFFSLCIQVFSQTELLRWTTLPHPPPPVRPPAPLVSEGPTDGPLLIKWRRCESRPNLCCKSAENGEERAGR